MKPEFTVSALTLKGSQYGQPCRFTALERARAAAAAGIPAIGVDVDDPTLDRAVLDHVAVPELEWADVGERVTGRKLERILDTCQAYGVTRVNAGVCGPVTFRGEVTENVISLAWALAPLNVTVAVEPVAFGGLANPEDVFRVVRSARRDTPNVGVLLDMWQFTAADPRWARWGADPALIAEVQVCGTRAQAYPPNTGRDVIFAGSQHRPYAAQSPVPVHNWLRRLLADGYTGPISYELPRDENSDLPLSEIADRAMADIAWVRARALGEPVAHAS